MKIVRFHANWCGPCKMYGPTWDAVVASNEDSNISFHDIDLDTPSDLGRKLKRVINVGSIPLTVKMSEDFEEVLDRKLGMLSESDLKEFIYGEEEK